jgi:hypothetical protein
MMHRNLYIWTVIGLLLITLSGCDPEEQVPAYLSINDIKVSSQYATQGSGNDNIKDAWVYIDGDLLGVFELPARFPVLAEGNHVVTVNPGIFENGIAATRVRYPFYTSYEISANFLPGQTVTLPDTLQLSYFSGIAYTWYEDFEGNTYSFDSISGSQSGFSAFNADDPFEGNYSGKLTVTTDKSYFEGSCTLDNADINTFQQTWIELNYKAEQPFDVGLLVLKASGTTKHYALTVNRSDTWNKIYIHVSDIVGSNIFGAESFKVYLAAGLEAGRTKSDIYIDNIKLIHN